jgi:hypothetical protein
VSDCPPSSCPYICQGVFGELLAGCAHARFTGGLSRTPHISEGKHLRLPRLLRTASSRRQLDLSCRSSLLVQSELRAHR